MKKIFLLFLILIFTNSCGYTPLYKNNNNKNIKFNYELIDTAGENEINNCTANPSDMDQPSATN